MYRLTILLMLLPALLAAGPLSELPKGIEIPRFQMITEGLFRGGQPDEKGFAFLKERGIKTVINLRQENDEAAIVKKLGMNYIQIAVEDPRPWSKISDTAIAKYFEVLNDPANYPIFFHCRRGADRTGAMAAFYRIVNQGWNSKKAYSEARDIGLRWWHKGIKEQVSKFRPIEKP